MSEKALSILNDDRILLKFKANAKKQSSKFDIHQIVPMYENIYQDTLKNYLISFK